MTQDAVSFSESFVAALLSWILISTRSIPSFDGSVVIEPPLIVTGWCTSVPTGADCLAVPRRGHHVGDQGFPGFSNGFTAKLATPGNPTMTRIRMETSLGVGSAAATGRAIGDPVRLSQPSLYTKQRPRDCGPSPCHSLFRRISAFVTSLVSEVLWIWTSDISSKWRRRDVLPRRRRRRWPAPTLLLRPGLVSRIPTLLGTSSRRSSRPRALWKARAPSAGAFCRPEGLDGPSRR